LIQSLETPFLNLECIGENPGLVNILVKLEYQNHAAISGNKWWKLKYNLIRAKEEGHKKLLTFGGAFSNHIYAVAAAANESGFESIGVIRGEETLPLNHVLAFAKNCGMDLHYISREAYMGKKDPQLIKELEKKFDRFYLIPEGGTNQLAVKGCAEWAQELLVQTSFDYLCLPVGTGGTMAGMVSGLKGEKQIIGFPVLKGADFLYEDISKLVEEFSGGNFSNWSLQTDYHFGGYAKSTPELITFVDQFKPTYHFPIERIYTGKMMWGVFDLVKQGFFKKGSTVLILHTGGLTAFPGHP
jgi:1-aminocyclopropane-1-carboxylate deaminase/D-cysteine desulfhydrase-like pyridoxal-dependent ACC family enzyme